MLPRLVPDDGLKALRVGPVLDLDDKPVVRPGDDLCLALRHSLQRQPCIGLVVARLDSKLSDLPHVRVAQVLYRLPSPDRRLRPGGSGGRDLEEEKDSGGEDKDSHSGRLRNWMPILKVSRGGGVRALCRSWNCESHGYLSCGVEKRNIFLV
ncbi:hypothetical protein BT93_L3588 [Corymbia citriodora subsp. variegata]|uniref:Uncharacterized protein n=1 Tax=Corymbia citriodora subsp. variegata TaxID=360336 RepID=A0A8T0CH23_CORYI|nr:hypothetical protein BT93_L3588 [Corymbia citriodora subsp. variegata]